MIAPDQMLGAYKLLARVGAGGMGEVWKAEDTRLGRIVAVKILPQQIASDTEAIARMRREARTAAGLYHPNIATIHSFEEAEGQTFIVMEFVDGEPLSKLIARGPLQESEVCRIGRGVADALSEAHEQGIVHRDIKPDNIIVRDHRVKVLDFGIAKRVGAESISSDDPTSFVTQQGMIVGTVHYMSPEQALGKPLDARTDLFSLGIVLYEAATGKLPFRGQTVTETITRLIRDEPEPPRVANPSISPALAMLIERCLRKNPEERIGSAKELSAQLERLASVAPTESMTEPMAAATTGAMTVPLPASKTVIDPAAAPPKKRMHKWPLIAIIFGPVIALGLAFVAMHHGEPQHVVSAPAATASAKPSTTTLAVTAPTTEPATVAAPVLSETKAPAPPPVATRDTAAAPPSTNTTPPPPATNTNTATQPPTPAPATPGAEQLYAQGLDLFVNGKGQEARRYFNEAIRADPRNAKAHFRLGEIALLNRNFDHASDQFTRALANGDHLEPREHSLCDLGLAIAHDDRLEANRIAREIRDQNPNDTDLAAIQDRFGTFFGQIEERPRGFRRRRQP